MALSNINVNIPASLIIVIRN